MDDEVGFFLFLILIAIVLLVFITITLWGIAKNKMADIESEMKYDFDKSRDKERNNRF